MAEKLLEVKNLRTEFKRDKTWVTAVNNVSFSIQPGEILGLVGESGCGKTTFGRTVLQLYNPTSGKIIYDGDARDPRAVVQPGEAGEADETQEQEVGA